MGPWFSWKPCNPESKPGASDNIFCLEKIICPKGVRQFFSKKKRGNPLLVCAQFHRPRYSFGVAWRVSTKRVKRIVKFDTLNS